MSGGMSPGNWKTLQRNRSFCFRLVQVIARRKFGEFFKMLRFKRFGDDVFTSKPFAKVHQLATVRAKRTVFPGQPVAGLFAGRALDCPHGYLVSSAIFLRSVTTLAASSCDTPASVRIFWTSSNIIFCCAAERCELLKTAWTSTANFFCWATVS